MTLAVLVIDMQRGLVDDAPRPHEAAAVIERINALTARARAAGVPVAFIQHENEVDLVFDSERWQLAGALNTDTRDARLRKTTPDAFSLFHYVDGQLACVESVNAPVDHMMSRKLLDAGRSPDPAVIADASVPLKNHLA